MLNLRLFLLLCLILPCQSLAAQYQLISASGKCSNPVFSMGDAKQQKSQTLQFDGHSLTLRYLPVHDTTKQAPVDLDENNKFQIQQNHVTGHVKQDADGAIMITQLNADIQQHGDKIILKPLTIRVNIKAVGQETPIFNCQGEATYQKQSLNSN